MKLIIRMANILIEFCKKIISVYLQMKYSFYKQFEIKVGNYRKIKDFLQIGFIDQDGLIHVSSEYCSLFNPNDIFIGGDFLYRKRFSMNVLIKDNNIFLEKHYNNDFIAFYNELQILHELRDIDCVPKIYYVDYKNASFVMNYINGFVLREKLAKSGAPIRDIDKKDNAQCEEFENKSIDMAVIIKNIVNDDLLQNIKECVYKIHQKKVLIIDIKFGNMLIKNGKAFFVDFNDSISFKYTPAFIFNIIKKSDLVRLKNIFINLE